MELRHSALEALRICDPAEKAQTVRELAGKADPLRILDEPPNLPGRPARPELRKATEVPHRSPFTPQGYAALIHSICHIEFNAVNLALDAVWRFDNMPQAFYADWLQVAKEEARHFELLREHLQSVGHDYGDFPAHDGLWIMCASTSKDVVARMALVPRTLEARGLDASQLIQAKLRKVGTADALKAIDILEIILSDEIGHVAVGNRWYAWVCQRESIEPMSHYAVLLDRHGAPRQKAPFNLTARRAAGFLERELEALTNTA